MTPLPPTLPPASLWRRWAALSYDLFILAAISMTYGACATAMQQTLGVTSNTPYHPTLQHPLYFVGWCLLLLAYYWLSWLKSGQTIGMKAWKIQLIALQGPLKPLTLLLRAITGALGALLLGLGYFYSLFNTQKDCWPDAITRTRIIKVGAHSK